MTNKNCSMKPSSYQATIRSDGNPWALGEISPCCASNGSEKNTHKTKDTYTCFSKQSLDCIGVEILGCRSLDRGIRLEMVEKLVCMKNLSGFKMVRL